MRTPGFLQNKVPAKKVITEKTDLDRGCAFADNWGQKSTLLLFFFFSWSMKHSGFFVDEMMVYCIFQMILAMHLQ